MVFIDTKNVPEISLQYYFFKKWKRLSETPNPVDYWDLGCWCWVVMMTRFDMFLWTPSVIEQGTGVITLVSNHVRQGRGHGHSTGHWYKQLQVKELQTVLMVFCWESSHLRANRKLHLTILTNNIIDWMNGVMSCLLGYYFMFQLTKSSHYSIKL